MDGVKVVEVDNVQLSCVVSLVHDVCPPSRKVRPTAVKDQLRPAAQNITMSSILGA